MAVVLTYGASHAGREGRPDGRPVRQAALAPTSRPRRRRLPSYRGDAVNGLAFNAEAATPDPRRLVAAYHRARGDPEPRARVHASGGYADLRQVHAWNQDFVRGSPAGRALRADGRRHRPGAGVHARLRRRPRRQFDARVELYASHEALLLDYERALTRIDVAHRAPYDVSGALGLDRASGPAQLDGAHVDFAAADPQPDRRQARPDRDAGGRRSRSSSASTPTTSRAG